MKTKQKVSIEETARAMNGLAHGSKPSSMLSALRNSVLSCRVQLISNAGYAIVLRKYRDTRLPARSSLSGQFDKNGRELCQLEAELSTAIRQDGTGKLAWGLMQSHLDTLYAIDELWFNGLISLQYGCSMEEQKAWRDTMVDLIPGMGMKLVSWALFIFDPWACKLLTVDCIHCDRLGIDQNKLRTSAPGRAYYCTVEQMCLEESRAIHPMYLPVVSQACLWLNHRGDGLTDHSGISARE